MIYCTSLRNSTVAPVFSVGSSGPVEITDMIFSTIGPAAGAIVVEWNVHESTQGSAAMWDSHIRLGGSSSSISEINLAKY
jgi:glucan 1,3-beta-glucosidase